MSKSTDGIGKSVGGALYVHRSACALLAPDLSRIVGMAEALAGGVSWSVAKIGLRGDVAVSLLDYQPFEDAAFPALRESHKVDLATQVVTTRRYGEDNPPILHRKELLLAPDHPDRQRYTRLTELLEKRGLFVEMSKRGRRRAWEDALAQADVAIEGHELRLIAKDPGFQQDVQRHKTAIARGGLSAPVAAMYAAGFLNGKNSFLDYGCGRGDDLKSLRALGLQARGWDPYFDPDASALVPHDLVNLGFVLNVIEAPEERADTLRKAFTLTRRCLAVSVMLTGKGDVSGQRPLGDGFLTSRGTFQKYYSQAEIRSFIADTLELTPIAVAPGLFFAFRSEELEQSYLSRRQIGLATPRPRNEHVEHKTQNGDVRRKYRKALIDQIAELIMTLARAPHSSEVPGPLIAALKTRLIPLSTAIVEASAALSDAEMMEAVARRREDVARFFALQAFTGRASYRDMSQSLRLDIKSFFGSLKAAEERGKELLFSAGDMDALHAEAQALHTAGIGQLVSDKFQFHVRQVDRLSGRFKTFVDIAQALAGSLSTATILRAHLGSRKLTALTYGDFATSALPRLSHRSKIDLRTGEIMAIDYLEAKHVSLLTHKSRYMAEDDPKLGIQKEFDKKLNQLFPAEHPTSKFTDLAEALIKQRLAVPY
tara:strand:+ start:32553 stop:34514 length:1962 start_codon:yes stop_codon:yes gene_type:complete